MLGFFKNFRQKIGERKRIFFSKNTHGKYRQNIDHNIGFQEKTPFFAENWRQSATIGDNRRQSVKIVFLKLTPDSILNGTTAGRRPTKRRATKRRF
jgi:hypothetical protein